MRKTLIYAGLITAATMTAATVGAQQQQQHMGMSGQSSASSQMSSQYDTSTIREVQEKLDKQGFDVGEVDGKWGNKTSSAVKQFQQSKGIEANGQLTTATLDALGVSSSASGIGRGIAPGSSQSGSMGSSMGGASGSIMQGGGMTSPSQVGPGGNSPDSGTGTSGSNSGASGGAGAGAGGAGGSGGGAGGGGGSR